MCLWEGKRVSKKYNNQQYKINNHINSKINFKILGQNKMNPLILNFSIRKILFCLIYEWDYLLLIISEI